MSITAGVEAGAWLQAAVPLGGGWAPPYRRLNRPASLKARCLPGGPPWWSVPQYSPISPQVTLSYGVFEGKLNVIKLPGPFSHEEDPSRWAWVETAG